jgi:hypothetical protein
MANQSAKKIVKQNKEMLFRAILLLAGFMVRYFIKHSQLNKPKNQTSLL